jgi:hypothetical protein
MGKVLHFPRDSGTESQAPSVKVWDGVASLLSTISDGQVRTVEQLGELLTRLEDAKKSLLNVGASSSPAHARLIEQARTIEFLIRIAREKLGELSSS